MVYMTGLWFVGRICDRLDTAGAPNNGMALSELDQYFPMLTFPLD